MLTEYFYDKTSRHARTRNIKRAKVYRQLWLVANALHI